MNCLDDGSLKKKQRRGRRERADQERVKEREEEMHADPIWKDRHKDVREKKRRQQMKKLIVNTKMKTTEEKKKNTKRCMHM